jgi:hypothetical protein
MSTFFSSLANLRSQGSLVDVHFRVQGCIFHAHKSVLASQSAPLAAMFENGMKETGKEDIWLPDTDVHAFGLMLDYMYGLPVEIKSSQCLSLLGVSAKWGVHALREACCSVLGSSISSETCWDILAASDAFACEDVKQRTLSFIFANFDVATTQPRFRVIPSPLLKEVRPSISHFLPFFCVFRVKNPNSLLIFRSHFTFFLWRGFFFFLVGLDQIVSSDRLWRVEEHVVFEACVSWIQVGFCFFCLFFFIRLSCLPQKCTPMHNSMIYTACPFLALNLHISHTGKC